MVKLWHKIQADLLDLLAYKASNWSYFSKKKFAKILAYLAFDILKIRKNYVIQAMVRHLNLSYDKAYKLAWQTYFTFITNAIEQASTAYLEGNEIDSKIIITGINNLIEAYKMQKGIIVISAHIGLWEVIPGWLARNGYKITVVVRRQTNHAVDKWFEKMRNRFGVQTSDSGYKLREHIKTLKNGNMLGLMCDQDAGTKGIFVDFLGEKASTVSGPATLAIKFQVPILALHMIPIPLSKYTCSNTSTCYEVKYHLIIEPPILPYFYPNNEIGIYTLTQDYTKLVEKWILNYPHQWFWLHRRWKSQPPNLQNYKL